MVTFRDKMRSSETNKVVFGTLPPVKKSSAADVNDSDADDEIL